MTKDAAWWRNYRARRRAESNPVATEPAPKAQRDDFPTPLAVAEARISTLEAEIRYLKQELARRPAEPTSLKPPTDLMAAQRQRDAWLRRVNRSRSSTSGRGRGA